MRSWMKTGVKTALATAAQLPMLYPRVQQRLRRSINIVYYHYFGDQQVFSDPYEDCSVSRFRKDLIFLRNHFEFVPLLTALRNEPTEGKPRLAITFDDGFDMYRNGVVDILSEFNVHATTFLITSCVDNKNLMWVNKLNAMRRLRGERMSGCCAGLMMKCGLPPPASGDLAQVAMMTWPMTNKEEMVDELWKMCGMPPLEGFLDEHRPYFTWRQLEDWVSRGHSIGMHTHTHTVCARIGDTLAEQEIRAPGAALKDRFRLNALPLAYPFGSRLEARLEEKLFQEGVFDFALGIRGFSKIGTPPHKLERVNGEQQLEFKMLGKALLPQGASRRSL